MFLHIIGDEFRTVADTVGDRIPETLLETAVVNEIIQHIIDLFRILTLQAVAVIDDVLVVVILLAFDMTADDDGRAAAYRFDDGVGTGLGHDDVTVLQEFVDIADKLMDLDPV